MKKNKKASPADPSQTMLDSIVKGIEEKKGNNIQIFDLRNIGHAVSDYFVICNADSGTQVDAIAYSVEHEVKENTGISPWKSEGFENREWILIDYADVVVHVFQTPIREFYKLERLWADAIVTNVTNENIQ
jgi:ribosome-associated protein